MSLSHVQKLTQLVPPLDPPPENVVDWKMAEDVFGISYPNDFRQLIHCYGNVMWCDLFRPVYPKTQTRAGCQESKEYVLELLSAMYGRATSGQKRQQRG